MVKKKYKCIRHRTNNGYINSEGKWCCWKCAKENRYFYPEGSVIEKYTSNNNKTEVRIVSTGPHTVKVEVWFIDKNPQILNWSEHHNYLSTAMRTFEGIVIRIESGIYPRDNNHIYSSSEDHETVEFEHPTLESVSSSVPLLTAVLEETG